MPLSWDFFQNNSLLKISFFPFSGTGEGSFQTTVQEGTPQKNGNVILGSTCTAQIANPPNIVSTPRPRGFCFVVVIATISLAFMRLR